MVIVVESNSDLPSCLNTEEKQFKKASQLAHLHRGSAAKAVKGPNPQGFFSRTVFVTLINGEEAVIQFRPEPLEMTPFKEAREILGNFVPEIEKLEDEEMDHNGIYVYCMSRIPGQTWLRGIRGHGPEGRIMINKTLARILCKGYVEGDSGTVIDEQLRPHLEVLASSEDSRIKPFNTDIQDMLEKIDQLRVLPLFISHYDLNEVNIMVDEECRVTGIVDWELSRKLPFGMGFGRIHTFAGEFEQKKFYMPEEFEDAERGFWTEIFEGVPTSVRKVIETNIETVNLSVRLGTLLNAFELEEGKLGPTNPVVLEALPKFLSYRIPQLRGSDAPYSK